MRVFYKEIFEDKTFEKIEAKKYVECEFINCIFKDTPEMASEISQLIKENKLVGCWYNPTLILSKIISSLHDDVNIIDFLNKAFIKSSEKSSKKRVNKLANKQLVMFDI